MCTWSTVLTRWNIRDPKVLWILLYCPVRICKRPEKPKQSCGDDSIIVRAMTAECGKSEKGGGDSDDSNRGVLGHRTAWRQTPHHNNSEVVLFHLELFKLWGKVRILKGSLHTLDPDGCARVSVPVPVF